VGEDEKGAHLVDTPGGPQRLTVVSESGLYKLIMRSDKDTARPFQDGVTKVVLPSIRKTGGGPRTPSEPRRSPSEPSRLSYSPKRLDAILAPFPAVLAPCRITLTLGE